MLEDDGAALLVPVVIPRTVAARAALLACASRCSTRESCLLTAPGVAGVADAPCFPDAEAAAAVLD